MLDDQTYYKQELEKIFTYHNSTEEQNKIMSEIRAKALELAQFILANTEVNRELNKCIELLEQVSMYANANIARNGLNN